MKPNACLTVMAVLLIAGVTVASAGWTEVAPVPLDPSGRQVKHGGWLVYNDDNGMVYAAKGYKTSDFYSYDPGEDSWVALKPIPNGTEGKPPKRGCRGAWDGDSYIYMTKGNNTLGFWRYDISQNTWTQMPDVPLGKWHKKVKGGTDMVFAELEGDGYVYLLKGYKQDFMRFNVDGDSWETLADAPKGKRPKWAKGSWLVYFDHGDDTTLFAHKAKYGELWTYDLAEDTWASSYVPGIPRQSGLTGKKKKPGEGSGAALYDGDIYTTKGGNTCEFWMFDPAIPVWAELDTIPQIGSTGRKKRVKHGGDLVSTGEGVFYALKGKKTCEFYKYTPPARVQARRPGGIAGVGTLRLDLRGANRVSVFDANGRLVGSDTELRSGVYLVRAEFGDNTRYYRYVVAR
ncbi:MAG: hypothetical protein JSU73_05790 [candidate division WOR-3 bacterium]|nr:MAG: hypothetical protein JSU73_05790 [candidate division WOR-3 bacterium]